MKIDKVSVVSDDQQKRSNEKDEAAFKVSVCDDGYLFIKENTFPIGYIV